jgi:hypothetical protein
VSHYTIEELIARWKKEELTSEQVIGQILQLLRAVEERLRALERRIGEGGAPPTTPRAERR